MEKVTKVPNRKKRRKISQIRNKWNLAINNLNAETKNISTKMNRQLTIERTSLNKGFQSHAALRLPTIVASRDITNNDITKMMTEKQYNKVWKIPYSNGNGNPDTEVIIQPSKYSDKSEMFKALMKIISSYIVEGISKNTYYPKIDKKNNIGLTPLKYLDANVTKQSPVSNEFIQNTALYIECKNSPYATLMQGSSCSEDGTPAHTYYPHRLNQ